jgi:hypothetical protein
MEVFSGNVRREERYEYALSSNFLNSAIRIKIYAIIALLLKIVTQINDPIHEKHISNKSHVLSGMKN